MDWEDSSQSVGTTSGSMVSFAKHFIFMAPGCIVDQVSIVGSGAILGRQRAARITEEFTLNMDWFTSSPYAVSFFTFRVNLFLISKRARMMKSVTSDNMISYVRVRHPDHY